MWQIVYDSTSSARKQCTHTIRSLSFIFKTIAFNNYVFLFCSFLCVQHCVVLIKCLFAPACAWDSCFNFEFNVRYVLRIEHVNREIKTAQHRECFLCGTDLRRKWSKVFSAIYVWAIVTAKWTIVIINFKALLWNTHSNNSSKCNTYYIHFARSLWKLRKGV